MLKVGGIYRTPFEPSGLFMVLTLEHPNDIYGGTAFGVFVGDHPRGMKSGTVGRYPVSELEGREYRLRIPKSTGAGFSRLAPYIPGEHWKDRHDRRIRLANEWESAIGAWCDYRGVEFKHIINSAKMVFRRGRAYAAWCYRRGWFRYCPDWQEQRGCSWYKANCPEQLLFAMSAHWLREQAAEPSDWDD